LFGQQAPDAALEVHGSDDHVAAPLACSRTAAAVRARDPEIEPVALLELRP